MATLHNPEPWTLGLRGAEATPDCELSQRSCGIGASRTQSYTGARLSHMNFHRTFRFELFVDSYTSGGCGERRRLPIVSVRSAASPPLSPAMKQDGHFTLLQFHPERSRFSSVFTSSST